jgi:hypothetical protein
MPMDKMGMKSRKTSLSVALFIAMVLTGLWVAMAGSFSIEYGDFPAFYTGAELAKEGKFASLHDDAQQAKLQAQQLSVRRSPVYFVRPHVYAALLSPLARLPLRQAFFAWAAVQGVILVLIAAWARGRFGNDALVLLALFPPAILAIGFGQDAVLYLGLAVLFAAGVALGCGMLKPHLMLLFPVVMLIQKRWRLLSGFAFGGALMAGLSLALGGLEGARVYLAFLQKQEGHLTPNPEHMINVHGLMVGLGLGNPVIRWILVAAVVGGVVAIARRDEWWQGLVAAQVGSALVAPHVFMYDSTIVALPALLVFFQEAGVRESGRVTRMAATLFFTPIPYLIQMAGIPWTIAPSLVLSGLLAALLLDVPLLAKDRPVLTAAPAR